MNYYEKSIVLINRLTKISAKGQTRQHRADKQIEQQPEQKIVKTPGMALRALHVSISSDLYNALKIHLSPILCGR